MSLKIEYRKLVSIDFAGKLFWFSLLLLLFSISPQLAFWASFAGVVGFLPGDGFGGTGGKSSGQVWWVFGGIVRVTCYLGAWLQAAA